MQRLGVSQSSAVREVIAQAGSVIALAQHHPREWLRQYHQLHITEARRLHDRARSVAVAVARRFREQELGGGRRAFELRHGLHALTAGSRYDGLFQPDFDAMAQSSAIESRTSPVAYLLQLYRIAQALEADAADDFKIRLAECRPDIAQKVLDTAEMNQPCRTLSIVNDVLAHAIDQYLSAPPCSDAAMQQSTGLGANRRALLIEVPYFPGSNEADTAHAHRYDPHTRVVRATTLADDQTTFF